MCDVRNSTAAVESGRYKNVNTLGAAVITAMLNAAGGTEIPFIFEGDGAMLCVPPELLDDARAVLLHTQALARKSFDARPAHRHPAGCPDTRGGRRYPGRPLSRLGPLRPGHVRRRRHGLRRPLHEGSGHRAALPGGAGKHPAGRQLRRPGMPLAGHSEPPWRNRERDGQGARRRRGGGRPHLSRARGQGARDLRRRRCLPSGLAARSRRSRSAAASSATRSACARWSAARGASGST